MLQTTIITLLTIRIMLCPRIFLPRFKNFKLPSKDKLFWLGLLVILAVCFCVYSYSLKGAFLWDDETMILANPAITQQTSFSLFVKPLSLEFANYYRPLQMLSYKIDYFLWGFNPFGFHLTSVLIHTVNALILYAVVLGLSASWGVAFFTALIFSIHPLLSESVNYISSRSDILLGLFILLAFLFYLKIQGRLLRSKYFYLSLICFIGALFCKESALVFPLFLLTYAIILGKDKKNSGVYFLVSLFYILIRVAVLLKFRPAHYEFPYLWLALTDIKVIAQYAALIFCPFNLHKNWLLPLVTSLKDYQFIAALLACAGMGLLFFRQRGKNKLFLFGLLWFLIFIIPALNTILLPLLNIPPSLGKVIISEAWVYLASMGMILAVCSFLIQAVSRRTKLLLYAVLICVVGFYSALTIKRNGLWSGNPVNFYGDLLRYHPDNASIRYNLANAYFQQNLCWQAIKEYKTVIALNPGHLRARSNLCNACVKCGKFDQAVAACQDLIRIKPDVFRAHYNLGEAYFYQGKYALAVAAYEKALTLKPDFKEATDALGLAKQKIEGQSSF